MHSGDIPRYLPDGDYIPYGWPQGTGIALIRLDGMSEDFDVLVSEISGYGCPKPTAIKAASALLSDGRYCTRVATTTAITLARDSWLKSLGIGVRFESVIPEGNINHILHEHNAKKFDTMSIEVETFSEQNAADVVVAPRF